MAKQKAAIIQLQGTIGGLTFVNSKRYGQHVRTARFSGKKGKVNKAFQEKCAKASPVTATGSPLLKQFKNIERGFADGSLWSRMLARMMKCGETAVPDLLDSLNGIELHPDYPFSALYGRAPELQVKGTRGRLGVDVHLERHPMFPAKVHPAHYLFELTVLFIDARGGCIRDAMETEWISFEEEPGCWAMTFPVPKGAEHYLLVGGVRGGVNERRVESFAACGFAVVGNGRV